MSTIGGAMRVSSTGMSAERYRMDVISTNIANANSSARPGEEPFRARLVMLGGNERGVRVLSTAASAAPFRREFEPGHPNADAEGYVRYTNIDPIREMIDMMGASRAYEANVAAFNSAREMMRAALTIGRAV